MTDKIKVVALALFCKQEQKYLIVRRGPDQSGAGFWEFAGGKVEAGESDLSALVREIKEELQFDLSAENLYFLARHDYAYPNRFVDISLFKYDVDSCCVPTLIDHDQYAWVSTQDLKNYQLSPADIYFLNFLI